MTKIKDLTPGEIQEIAILSAKNLGEAAIGTLFLKEKLSISFDNSLPACAGINMEDYRVFFNSELISKTSLEILLHNEKEVIEAHLPYYGGGDFYGEFIRTYKEGLILHEIGHYLYTVPFAQEWDNYQKYCPNFKVRDDLEINIPFELVKFEENVIEDSYIQTAILKDYPARRYKNALFFLQAFSQEPSRYLEQLKSLDKISIQGKLYYFILRAYHPENEDIMNYNNLKEKLGWSPETIRAFDKACVIIDSQARSRFTMEVVAPLVMKDLVEDIGKTDPNSQSGQGSLLDSDKIRIGDPSSSQNGSQGDSGDQKENQDQQQSDQGETGDQQDSQENQAGGSASQESTSESEGTSNEDKEGNSGDNGAKEKEEGKESQKDGQSSQEESKSNGKDPESQESSNSSKLTEEQVKVFEEEIKKACEELNKQLNESSKEREEVNKEEVFKEATDEEKLNEQLEELDVAVIEASEWDKKGSYLNDLGQNLYLDCSSYFEKLYNVSDYTVHNLDHGDIDPDMLVSWYTEKNTNIYQMDFKTKQGRTFQMIFICDDSGSMQGDSWKNTSQTIAALVHAMDDVGIPSAIYLFSDKTRQIKTIKEDCSLEGTESSVLSIMNSNFDGGCTDPTRVFEALKVDATYQGEETKIVFFLTDGVFMSSEYHSVNDSIKELSARGNWYFISIGIGLSKNAQQCLEKYTQPGIFKNYNVNELASHLGEDIYNIIVDDFIKL